MSQEFIAEKEPLCLSASPQAIYTHSAVEALSTGQASGRLGGVSDL